MNRVDNRILFERSKEWEEQGRTLASQALTARDSLVYRPPNGFHFAYTPLSARDRVISHLERWECLIPQEIGLIAVGNSLAIQGGGAVVLGHRARESEGPIYTYLSAPLKAMTRIKIVPSKGIAPEKTLTLKNLERIVGPQGIIKLERLDRPLN